MLLPRYSTSTTMGNYLQKRGDIFSMDGIEGNVRFKSPKGRYSCHDHGFRLSKLLKALRYCSYNTETALKKWSERSVFQFHSSLDLFDQTFFRHLDCTSSLTLCHCRGWDYGASLCHWSPACRALCCCSGEEMCVECVSSTFLIFVICFVQSTSGF